MDNDQFCKCANCQKLAHRPRRRQPVLHQRPPQRLLLPVRQRSRQARRQEAPRQTHRLPRVHDPRRAAAEVPAGAERARPVLLRLQSPELRPRLVRARGGTAQAVAAGISRPHAVPVALLHLSRRDREQREVPLLPRLLRPRRRRAIRSLPAVRLSRGVPLRLRAGGRGVRHLPADGRPQR